MKKRLLRLAAAILAFVIGTSFMTGCDLIITDNQRDMDLVVAEVSIGNGAPTEKIYKKDLISSYINYGYTLVQSNGMTVKEAFEYIMDSLVSNVILVQSAVQYLSDGDEYDVEGLLTEEEKVKATYETNKAFNDLIESYMDEEEETVEGETVTVEARTAPSKAKPYAEEYEGIDKFWEEYVKNNPTADEEDKENLFFADYNAKGFLSKGIVTGFNDNFETTDINVKRAYNKVLKVLDTNGLLGSGFNFESGSIYDSEYYKNTLEGQFEQVLLQKYEKEMTKDILSEVSYDDLAARYVEMYEAQRDKNATDYDAVLSEASASSPVLYYKDLAGYGYIYNLLLGVNSIQDAQIQELEAQTNLTDAEKAAKREQILAATTAKDQRSTWITEGYDYDYQTNSFTGTYNLSSSPISFKGQVKWLNEDEKDEEDYVAKYEVESLVEYGLDEFVDFMEEYLYGEKLTGVESNYYKKATPTALPNEFDEKVNDLLFAFSTDPGSLNTYKGYLVTSKADIGKNENYVEEFANASREVIEMADGSYIMVGTKFGYHIVFKSQKISASENATTLDEYLDKNSYGIEKTGTWAEYYQEMIQDIETWAEDNNTDFYLYQLQQAYVTNKLNTDLNEMQTAILCKYKEYDEENETYTDYKKEFVKIYTDRYSEFLTEK